MKPVFRSHCVICGWSTRGKSVVGALRALSSRPLIILHDQAEVVLRDVGSIPNVFVVQGDAADPRVLVSVDVAHAYSVLVLASESIANFSDARSVEIALSVERIQSAVSTVVELRDIRNKVNFSWTKVDDLVTSEHIAVCMLAQGIRHVMGAADETRIGAADDQNVLKSYTQLINPHQKKSQLFRVNIPLARVSHLTFEAVMNVGIDLGLLPVALVGYIRHEIVDSQQGKSKWISWKADVNSLPEPKKAIGTMWNEWPNEHSDIGVLVLARSLDSAKQLSQRLIEISNFRH